MALEKIESIDLIEIVANGCVQVRVKTSVLDDGAEIGSSFRRYVVAPGDDYSGQPQRVKDVCSVIHTPETIIQYQAILAPQD